MLELELMRGDTMEAWELCCVLIYSIHCSIVSMHGGRAEKVGGSLCRRVHPASGKDVGVIYIRCCQSGGRSHPRSSVHRFVEFFESRRSLGDANLKKKKKRRHHSLRHQAIIMHIYIYGLFAELAPLREIGLSSAAANSVLCFLESVYNSIYTIVVRVFRKARDLTLGRSLLDRRRPV
jgi:hypothetical protein